MKRISEKRRRLNAAVAPFRQAMKERIRRCEYCLHPADPQWLTLHELARGVHRAKALDKPFALLCLHWTHWEVGGKLTCCHSIVQAEPLARQLARLYMVRASDYSLEDFWELRGRRFPDQCAVDAEIEQLLARTK